MRWFHLVAVLAVAAGANVAANLWLPDAWDVPFNLAAGALALGVALHAGATLHELGLRPDRLRRGFVVGLLAAASIVAAVVGLAFVPGARRFLADDRVVGASAGAIAFQALVRIPLATALYEELLFRGVVFGLLVRHLTVLAAAAISALLFGLWHVLPTIATLEVNPAGDVVAGTAGATLAVAAAVAGTAVAGAGFLWLRLRAESLVAPVLAHIATNAPALVLAWLLAGRGVS